MIYFQDPPKGLPELLDYTSCLVHLAVFGILGVISPKLLLDVLDMANLLVQNGIVSIQNSIADSERIWQISAVTMSLYYDMQLSTKI